LTSPYLRSTSRSCLYRSRARHWSNSSPSSAKLLATAAQLPAQVPAGGPGQRL
jgi:hypothetical protein